MATVISILHPSPYPLQGEAGLVLSLTFKQPTEGSEEQGYRMVARAEETGRVIGRWVSDCALTATETALLWCSKSLDEQGDPLWSLAMGVESLDWQRVLDTVTEYQPGEHPKIPPRQVVSILAGNFPATLVAPAPARRALTGPVVRRPGQPIERAEAPAAPPAQPRPQRPQRALPAPQPEVEAAPVRARAPERVKVEMGEEEQELTAVIREMYRALKSGSASAEDVRSAMLQIAGPEEDEEDEDEDDLTTWDDEDEDEDGSDEESEDEEEDGDEDEDSEDEDEDSDDEEGEEEVAEGAAEGDEEASLDWDKGMRLYGADQRAYDKLARTQQRAMEIQQRVRAHLEAQAAAEAHAAQQAAAEVAAAQQAEPAKPRRNLRRLAEAVAEAPAPAPEPAPEPAVEAEQEPVKRRRAKKSA